MGPPMRLWEDRGGGDGANQAEARPEAATLWRRDRPSLHDPASLVGRVPPDRGTSVVTVTPL